MKYETPELTASTPAVNAIQATPAGKDNPPHPDSASMDVRDSIGAYEDWE